MQTIRMLYKPKHAKAAMRLFAVVDDEDLPLVSPYRWHAVPREHTFHAMTRTASQKTLYMHRLIMRPAPGLVVDHRNGNGLDNRRENLRSVRQQQNAWNSRHRVRNVTSLFKGVSFEIWTQRYRGMMTVNARAIPLGRFDSEVDAALAYDEAAKHYFGEFARLNFPFGVEDEEF